MERPKTDHRVPAGRVRELRALFESKTPGKLPSPQEFERTKAQVALHNLRYFTKHQFAPVSPPPSSNWTVFEQLDDGAFWLEGLDQAMHDRDPVAANRAVLLFFLQEFAPHLVGEADELLRENAGREPELFTSLMRAYPNPHSDEHYVVLFTNGLEGEKKTDRLTGRDLIKNPSSTACDDPAACGR
ncbi:hypothetical protein BASA82_000419 [Batrachochytrium salamandrivorans]|nr:hypothetical protein BASA82_000419 [Batrachochytrium salamandrivorans]